MLITTAGQLTNSITMVTDGEGGTWTRTPGTDMWTPSAASAIGPVSSAELTDMFPPLTPESRRR